MLVPGDAVAAPQFSQYPASATLTAGETAAFACEAAEELLQLHWLKDGRPIDEPSAAAEGATNGSRFKFTRDGRQYRLEIVGVQAQDVGQYQAKAVGQKGEQLAAFSLNVTAN